MATAGVAIGDPHTWITTADYPLTAWDQGHDGIVSVAFIYDRTGRVFQCKVLASSGWPELDQQTCAALGARARIRPSTDDAGQAIGTRSTLRFNWTLPDRPPQPIPPSSPDLEIDVVAIPADAKRLTIDLMSVVADDGRVESCELADKRGTGSKALDQAACRTVGGDRFPVIRDPSGKPMRYLQFVKVAFVAGPAQ